MTNRHAPRYAPAFLPMPEVFPTIRHTTFCASRNPAPVRQKVLHPIALRQGEYVYKALETGAEMFFVVSGEIEVTPTPYTQYPTPCTMHPTPCTLHPTLYTRGRSQYPFIFFSLLYSPLKVL